MYVAFAFMYMIGLYICIKEDAPVVRGMFWYFIKIKLKLTSDDEMKKKKKKLPKA